jgi:hypothetical protein
MIPRLPTGQNLSADIVAKLDTLLAIAPVETRNFLETLSMARLPADERELEGFASEHPEQFPAFEIVLLTAYYSLADVQSMLGYFGQTARDSEVGLSQEELAGAERIRRTFGEERHSEASE